MSGFQEVAKTDELKDGTLKKVTLGGREILLARAGNSYFAADNRCPHLSGDLSRGTLNGTVVTCPLHRSRFDLKDGKVVRWTDFTGLKLSAATLLKKPRPLTTHQVKVEGNGIFVAVKEG